MRRQTTKKEPEIDERLKQLLMMRKEDMTMGQLFELVRYRPEEMDGYIFEQKINRTISEEFVRLQSRVDGAFNAVTGSYQKMAEFEQKIDILRAQLSRIGKFDGQIDSFTRTQQDHASQMQSLSDRLMDLFTQFRQNNEGLSKRIFKIEGDIREINKIIDEPAEIKKEKKKKFDDQLDAMEMRLAQKHLELTSQFAEFQNETTQNRLETQKIVSSLKLGFEAIAEPFQKHGFQITEHKSELEKHKKVIEELSEHVEAIKKYSQLTNLHIEAYLPFQVASQIYETCEVLAKQKLKTVFRKKFTTQIEELEQNLLNCCNPSTFGQYKSPFRKISYELPKSYLQPDISSEEPQGDQDGEKKLKLKLGKFLKEKLQRDATRDSSIENVFILFGGVSTDQLLVKIREEIFGFKYADEHIFKINTERELAQSKKAAADQVKGQAAPVADFGALRMQVNYELMKNKVNVEALVKKTFSQLRDSLDVLEERLDNRFLKVDGEKDRLNDELEKTQLKIQQAEERVSQALKKQADLEMSFSYQTTETKTFISKNIETAFAKKFEHLKEEASAAAIQRLVSGGYEQGKKSVGLDDEGKLKAQSSESNLHSTSLKEISQKTTDKKRENAKSQNGPEISQSPTLSSQSNCSVSVLDIDNKTPQEINGSEQQQRILKKNQEKEKKTINEQSKKLPQERYQTKKESQNRVKVHTRNSSMKLKISNSYKDQILEESNYQAENQAPLTPTINSDQHRQLKVASRIDEVDPKEAQETLKSQQTNTQEEQVNQKKHDQKLKERTKVQQPPSGEIIEEKDEYTPVSPKSLSSLEVQSATPDFDQNDGRQVIFSQVQEKISRENSNRHLADKPYPNIKVQVQDQHFSTLTIKNDNIHQQKVDDSKPLSSTVLVQDSVSDVSSPPVQIDHQQNVMENINQMKNDRIQHLIHRQRQSSQRIQSLGVQIQNAQNFLAQATAPSMMLPPVQEPEQKISERIVKQPSQSPTRKVGRPDSATSKRSRISNRSISRKKTILTNKLSQGGLGDSEIDEDYDDEYEEEEVVDMKLYLKEEVFQSYKTAQDQFNQQLIAELEKRDQILKHFHTEQAEHNADTLAFLEIVNAVDFRIMEKAELKIYAAIQQHDAMFDRFRDTITFDVKRWRQENVDMKIIVQRNFTKIDHIQDLINNLNLREQKFQELMLSQFNNLSGLWDLQVRLNKQDEQDKKSTNLIGMREKELQPSSLPGRNLTQTTQGPSMSIDPRCLNCESDSGQKQIIFQKFKMACLSYKPSPIQLDGGLFLSREEIFGLQDQSLVQVKESQMITRTSLQNLNNLVKRLIEELVQVAALKSAKVNLGLATQDPKTIISVAKKVEEVKDRKLLLSQAVTSSQTLDANRFAQLRKDMRTQPGSSRPVHKVLVLENISNNVITSRGANSLQSIDRLATNSLGSDFQVNVASTQVQTDRSRVNKIQLRETIDSLALPQITPRSTAISNFDSKALSSTTNKARLSQTNGFQK